MVPGLLPPFFIGSCAPCPPGPPVSFLLPPVSSPPFPAFLGVAFFCHGRLLACLDAFTSSCAGAGCAVAFLVVPSLAGCCFCFPFPFLLLYPGRRLCCVRLKVLLLYRSATLASLLRVAPRLPKHARVLGGGSQAPAALPPLFSPDWPACALLCRFHPPLPPQVSLNRLEGSAPAR